ncbi:Na+/H+ antiporter family protein [Crassaminicella thermophila]|uniref:Na+/H+ antiporter family protein n=1 Tax=Crassaminicella thermophila TaxID=2599308 RepID=A0A5C0SIP8_CRATE|nr:Na+/H+ antiporter family protein [Crassaminicella thermophila]QEK13088.1 Na+/H+ antiporter family protein [Crassaminicella thermophila]
MLTNPVVLSVIIMSVLCLLKLNVILSLIIAAIAGGLIAGIPLGDVMGTLVGGMGGNAETALSYILLGALAAAIHKTGLATILSKKIASTIKGKGTALLVLIAIISCFSQNLIPVHIAFIPILIPPLLSVMNKLKIDRRAAACALTFGLKTPYIALPVGFGLIFHGIIADQMTQNGMEIAKMDVWKGLWLPGIGMVIGLFIALFVSYRKPREYKMENAMEEVAVTSEEVKLTTAHFAALAGAIAALVIQLTIGSLPLGAIVGLAIMTIFGAIKFKDLDELMSSGIGMMGFIAFVMLVASGYGAVIRETGGVEALVNATAGMVGGSKLLAAIVMIILGLIITMGIGTSFGTIPIIAVIYVPLCLKVGFSPLATAVLIGTAAALGDAGSPASDSTLGPTSGLNADGQHDHIWDTCVPTFLHYNIPLVIFGVIGALIF